MSALNSKVIDELRALEAGGAPGLLKELIDLFLKEADGHLAKMRAAIASREAQPFERSAHTLKGSSGNLGAMTLSKICGELQTAGRAADWTRIAALFPGLESEYRDAKAALEAERARS